MKKQRYLVMILLLALLVPIGLSLWSRLAGDAGLIDGRLRECSSKPNCVCSETLGNASFVEPLTISGDVDAAFATLKDFLQDEPRVSIEEFDSDYIHSVFKTPLMRFCDDVEFRLDREAGVIHVRSAARIGYSDLGQNRSRVEWIRAHWNTPGGKAPR